MHPHPPMPPSPFPPYQRWYSDVEPAYERPAECECHFPPIPNQCVCVTEEDAENWNGAYSAMSAISAGLDIQAIASAAQLLTSANYWNGTHDTVSANSATWQQLPEVSSTLAEWAQSAIWIASTLSAHPVYTDDDTISGDGTIERPLGIPLFNRYDQLFEYLESITADATTLDMLKAAMEQCKEELLTQIAELSGGHIQNYGLIQELMGGSTSSDNVKWINDNRMVASSTNTYASNTAVNCMYYSTYEG